MHRITNWLAGVLSLLLISSPAAGWACDLSCSLHQSHSNCRTMDEDTNKDDSSTSMPGMDMGSDNGANSAVPDTVIVATQTQSMWMASQQKVVTERFEHATEGRTPTEVMRDHTKGLSSCVHGACTQISVSASPPSVDHCRPGSLHRVAVRVSSPVNLFISFHSLRAEKPRTRVLVADSLVTALRI